MQHPSARTLSGKPPDAHKANSRCSQGNQSLPTGKPVDAVHKNYFLDEIIYFHVEKIYFHDVIIYFHDVKIVFV